MSKPNEFYTSFNESIKLAKRNLLSLSNESQDVSDPNNYLTWLGLQEHIVTYFSLYCFAVGNNKYIRVQGKTDAIVMKKFSHKVIDNPTPDPSASTSAKSPLNSEDDDTVQIGHKWKASMSQEDETCDVDVTRVQYSCYQTAPYYQKIKAAKLSRADILKMRVYKSPLTKNKESKSPYQDINKRYIEFVCDAVGSRFIPDICRYIIGDLDEVTPEKVIDVFASHTVQFVNFMSYFATTKLASSMAYVRNIFESTRPNIIFYPSTVLSVETQRLRWHSGFTTTLFTQARYETGSGTLYYNVDFVSFITWCTSKYTRYDATEPDETIHDTDFYMSYEDHLEKNEVYIKYKQLIQLVLNKGGDFIMNAISSKLDGGMMSGVIEKISPLLGMLKIMK